MRDKESIKEKITKMEELSFATDNIYNKKYLLTQK